MNVKTHIKSGAWTGNHNEKLVRAATKPAGLKVKTSVKAGGATLNHNEALTRARR